MSGFNSLTGYDPLLGSPNAPTTAPSVQPTAFITPPDPIVKVEMKYYICIVPNASLHRFDGTRIGFRFGYLETDVEATQQYLDWEIRGGNSFIRFATPEEIQDAKMRIDPRGTIKQQVREEVEAELRMTLEAEIRAKLGMPPTDSREQANQLSPEARISGVDALEKLKSSSRVTKVPGATVIMDSPAAPLKGIVGSDTIKDAAAGSGG